MDEPLRVPQSSPLYPARLRDRLGDEAPLALEGLGALRLLRAPLCALFCSPDSPPGARLATLDAARRLADESAAVVSGFQSPLEREALGILLAARATVVFVPARSLRGMRLQEEWEIALGAGRMLLVSGAPANRRRADARLAEARNRLVAALADRVAIVHAAPAGRLYRLAREVVGRGQPLLCAPHPDNRDLALLGAQPL